MSLQKSAIDVLEHEYSLLRLLYHRNKNQHRVATWWRHLNTLKRDLTKLLALLRTEKKTKADNEKRKVVILKLGYHVRKSVVSKCHRAFHGIVALGQFLTLGLTLLGMLAKLDACVANIEGLEEYMAARRASGTHEVKQVSDADASAVVSVIADDLGEEIGEVVQAETVDNGEKKRKSMGEPQDSVIKKKKKSKSLDINSSRSDGHVSIKSSDPNKRKEKKERKKKKSKSAIDDIFG